MIISHTAANLGGCCSLFNAQLGFLLWGTKDWMLGKFLLYCQLSLSKMKEAKKMEMSSHELTSFCKLSPPHTHTCTLYLRTMRTNIIKNLLKCPTLLYKWPHLIPMQVFRNCIIIATFQVKKLII